jgi:hypothetical protein
MDLNKFDKLILELKKQNFKHVAELVDEIEEELIFNCFHKDLNKDQKEVLLSDLQPFFLKLLEYGRLILSKKVEVLRPIAHKLIALSSYLTEDFINSEKHYEIYFNDHNLNKNSLRHIVYYLDSFFQNWGFKLIKEINSYLSEHLVIRSEPHNYYTKAKILDIGKYQGSSINDLLDNQVPYIYSCTAKYEEFCLHPFVLLDMRLSYSENHFFLLVKETFIKIGDRMEVSNMEELIDFFWEDRGGDQYTDQGYYPDDKSNYDIHEGSQIPPISHIPID